MNSNRYLKQVLFPRIGLEGQRRIECSSVALIGCGALGSASADSLVRAGVGRLVVVDRDFIEPDNLQRQSLYDESDIEDQLPKAIAAARKLRRINSGVEVEPCVSDVTAANLGQLAGGCDLLVDATDNFETRYLINDYAVEQCKPWVYGACVASEGLVMPILPGRTPCLRCVFPDPPPPGSTPTCHTAGIIAPIVKIVSSLQITEALKILSGRLEDVRPVMISVDCWKGEFRSLDVSSLGPSPDCPTCGQNRFDFLEQARRTKAVSLCGGDTYQVHPTQRGVVPLSALRERLEQVAVPVRGSEFLIQFEVEQRHLTVFQDGRAIIRGVKSGEEARSYYTRYVGL